MVEETQGERDEREKELLTLEVYITAGTSAQHNAKTCAVVLAVSFLSLLQIHSLSFHLTFFCLSHYRNKLHLDSLIGVAARKVSFDTSPWKP